MLGYRDLTRSFSPFMTISLTSLKSLRTSLSIVYPSNALGVFTDINMSGMDIDVALEKAQKKALELIGNMK